jgi:ubiquinone biosynthesis protein
VLLQKTLLNIEGLGRQLYPALNLWDTAKPFLEQWVSERYSLQTVSKRLQEDAPALLESLPLIPDLVLQQLRRPKKQLRPVASTPQWVLPVTALGALALGFGIAQSIAGQGWLMLGGGCLICAIVLRHR